MARDELGGGSDVQGASGGFVNRGVWSTANSYSPRDVVTWLGSTFAALNSIAVGGSNPRVDSANWIVWAQGGGEIAYAEYTGVDIAMTVNFQLYDVPGVQIVVPAGTGPYTIEGMIQMSMTTTATNGAGLASASLWDVDNAVTLVQGVLQDQVVTTGKVIQGVAAFKKRFPATSTSRTFKLQGAAVLNNVTVKMQAPGTTASNQQPFLQAIAL